MLTIILSLVVIGLLTYVYIWASSRKNYWKNKNVPYIDSPLLFGNFFKATFLMEHVNKPLSELYYHPNAVGKPFVGINLFYKPTLLIRDPELIKQIMIKDFNYFSNRHTGTSPETDPLAGNNLFQINNPTWKELRNKLSPIFTSGKMKQMFYMVEKIGNTMREVTIDMVKSGKSEIEIRSLIRMFTIDSICLVAFATESNCLQNPKSEFLQKAKNAFQTRWVDKISGNLVFFLSDLMEMLRMKTFNPEFGEFLRGLFNAVMDERIKDGGVRHDLIDALIAIKNAEADSKNSIFTEDVLLAQAIIFFFAGFETSSSTLEFFFYEIAKNPLVQAKIKDEIRAGLQKHKEITYEMITNDLPYMTCAIKETLRLYPILSLLDRECSLPAGETSYSLEPFSSFKIPNKMPIYIPIGVIQRDPEYFPEPEKFDPTRFEDAKNEHCYMPFGIGPRICIGERFAMMQMRIAIVNLLKSFNVELPSDVPDQVELDKSSILMHPKKSIKLKFVTNAI